MVVSNSSRDRHVPSGPRVAVVGGGAAGLGASRRLAEAGVHVTLLEAADRLGGCVRTVDFGGDRLDVGAEALHTAAVEPLKLVAELGLADDLVESRSAPTWIVARGRLRPLPAGIGPAGPTRVLPLVGARLLSPAGIARAALEPLVPAMSGGEDVTVGDVLTHRFGRQVVGRIIDPLLGGLHAGDVHRLSLASATPQLASLLGRHRSIVLAGRRRGASTAHGFVTLRGGLGRLFDRAAERHVGDLRTGVQVRAVVDTGRSARRYRVVTDVEELTVDAIVLAVPPRPVADLLGHLAPDVLPALDRMRSASVAVSLLAYPPEVARLPALQGTGLLVPSTSGRLLKAATFVSTKWPHLSSPHVLVRASAGRADDDRATRMDDAGLVDAVTRDLADLTGLPDRPIDQRVMRWDHAMPQLEVGHAERVGAVRSGLATHPALALAGAAYDGVGVASALRSGTVAADRVLAHLAGVPA